MRSFINSELELCLASSIFLPRDVCSSLVWRVSGPRVALDIHPELVICGTGYVCYCISVELPKAYLRRHYHGIPDDLEHESCEYGPSRKAVINWLTFQ